jgi:DNA adenine methylase
LKFKSPLRFPGGKSKALKHFVHLFPDKVTEYREPMVGGGSVFFHAKNKNLANKYWINDIYYPLIDFYENVADSSNNSLLVSILFNLKNYQEIGGPRAFKDYFQSLRNEDWSVFSLDNARKFFILNRCSFSGCTEAGGFSPQAATKRFTKSSIERLRPMPEALRDVKITCRDFQEVIEAPGEDVFLFLDPPYKINQALYGKKGQLHKDFDHDRLADCLLDTKHKFLMTYNDCEYIRNLYSWAYIKEFDLQYSMKNRNKGKEILISNYQIG